MTMSADWAQGKFDYSNFRLTCFSFVHSANFASETNPGWNSSTMFDTCLHTWRQSLLCPAGAVLVAVQVVQAESLLIKQKNPETAVTSFTSRADPFSRGRKESSQAVKGVNFPDLPVVNAFIFTWESILLSLLTCSNFEPTAQVDTCPQRYKKTNHRSYSFAVRKSDCPTEWKNTISSRDSWCWYSAGVLSSSFQCLIVLVVVYVSRSTMNVDRRQTGDRQETDRRSD